MRVMNTYRSAFFMVMSILCFVLIGCEKDPNTPDNKGSKGAGKIAGHEYVDLGLPSGLKWATCNVGANSPEEYGDYFAWGETEPYYSRDPLTWKDGKSSGYDWMSYRWCNGSNTILTKYNNNSDFGAEDNKLTLDLEDDAASANWGVSWRMPTIVDWIELIRYCKLEEAILNDVFGFKLTSLKNSNSIFFPAAGRRYDTLLRGAGYVGCYWSSSLNEDGPDDAWLVYFRYRDLSKNDSYRCYGLSIRPVTE